MKIACNYFHLSAHLKLLNSRYNDNLNVKWQLWMIGWIIAVINRIKEGDFGLNFIVGRYKISEYIKNYITNDALNVANTVNLSIMLYNI